MRKNVKARTYNFWNPLAPILKTELEIAFSFKVSKYSLCLETAWKWEVVSFQQKLQKCVEKASKLVHHNF